MILCICHQKGDKKRVAWLEFGGEVSFGMVGQLLWSYGHRASCPFHRLKPAVIAGKLLRSYMAVCIKVLTVSYLLSSIADISGLTITYLPNIR